MALMKPLTEQEIRAAFVNCTRRGEAPVRPARPGRPPLGRHRMYLGWRDPQSPERAYLVLELNGHPKALVLRSPSPTSWQTRRSMCSMRRPPTPAASP